MNKTQLIEKAVKLGLDASGTVKQLKDRIKAHKDKPQEVVSATIKKNPDREKYRHGAHQPKERKVARNLQVEKED